MSDDVDPRHATNRHLGVRLAALGLAGLLAFAWAPANLRAASTWSKNLFVPSANVYQDPYPNACVAATAMTILNTIAYRHAGGAGYRWTPSVVKDSRNPAYVRDITRSSPSRGRTTPSR